MPKISRRPVDPEKFGYYINNLWSAFTLMDSKEDIRLLFKDLFTHTEYKMFAKRLEIARRLFYHETYDAIKKELSVTAGTIARINNILNEKGEGLRKAHGKLELLEAGHREREKRKTDDMANPFRKQFRNHQKTVVGTLLKVGAIKLDKAISKKLKEKTAKKQLET